jgi:hypothetical protein
MHMILKLGTFSYMLPLLCLKYYIANPTSLLLLLLILGSTNTGLFCPTVKGEQKYFITLTTVHVNGCFAVASNRRGLWQSAGFEDTKTGASNRRRDWPSAEFKDTKTEWNQELMKDAVCSAYLIMLDDLVSMI